MGCRHTSMIDRIGVLDEYGVYFTASCATTPLISPALRTPKALTVDYPPHPISFVLTVAGVPFDKRLACGLLKRMESIIEQGKVCTADHSCCCGCLCVAPILGASPLLSLAARRGTHPVSSFRLSWVRSLT